MVKKLISVILAVCLITATAVQATAYTVYDGSISSTYVDLAKRVLPDLKINEDYVFCRDGQYTYSLFVGEFTVEDGIFRSVGDVYGYEFVSPSTAYGSNSTELRMFSDSNITIVTNDKVVYSNLFGYPKLTEGGAHYEFITAFLLCVALCMFIMHCLFDFVLRRRNTRRFYSR